MITSDSGPAASKEWQSAVTEHATRFHDAIIDSLPLNDQIMDSFPHGTCGDASPLLGQYLFDQGLGQWTYRNGECDRQTHAWIERNGLLVDITAYQFSDISEPVIVTFETSWHSKFETFAENDEPALIDIYDDYTRKRLRRMFAKITGRLTS